jgi:3',5'-cyclic AMP phosphodiesterase CpdA
VNPVRAHHGGESGTAFLLPIGFAAALAAIVGASGADAPFVQVASDPVLVGAGDIADCETESDQATATLLDGIDGTVFTAGDNVYPFGRAIDFYDCYEPTWGRHKARTLAAPGNHDYLAAGAAPYFAYFGPLAGPAGRGYYSYNRGAWHIISLNSNIAAQAGSAQEQWLRADLAANRTLCTLAYWHHPLFSSGQHGNDPTMHDVWQALQDFGADVVVSGHDHDYEQFHRQNVDGVADVNGIREFVVGTGGTSLRPFADIKANSAVRDSSTHGVLALTLHPASYDWEFVPVAGQTFTDLGSRPCVGTAPSPVGGRGFAIGGAAPGSEMIWTTGTAQSAYAVARFVDGTTTILPPTNLLPASATDFADTTAAAGRFTCYLLLPLGPSGVIGRSDAMCIVPGSRSSAGAPPNVHLQLDQGSVAMLTWSPAGGASSGYSLLTIPLNGGPPEVVSLPTVATRAMHETSGVPTCYVLFVRSGASVTGNSDVLCAVPGQSALSAANAISAFPLQR